MIYAVIGIMRSGTSMMMQCLKAGGMEVVFSEANDRANSRMRTEEYDPNPNGYFGLEEKDKQSPEYPNQFEGKLIKIYSTDIVKMHDTKGFTAVHMTRNPKEQVASLDRMARRHVGYEVVDVERVNREDMERLKAKKDCVSLTELTYADVLEDPLGAFKKLMDAGWPIDPALAAAGVRPDLYRNKV